jgi:signal transduction histidine kinase
MGERALERLRAELDDLRASQARLVGAVDARSRELERDLHDGVQQDLVALAVNLQRARQLCDSDPAAAGTLLDEVGTDLRAALEALRLLAQRVYPPLLEARGLPAALRAAAAGLGIRARIDAAALAACSPEVCAAVYLCCVEALEHGAGVAGGARATISATRADGALRFDVALDGGGGPGPALELTRARLEALGGRLTAACDPGGGVRFSGTLPVE